MDRRTALPGGTILRFPGIECELGAEIGRGSNALVYEGSYRDALDQTRVHHILVKELFPLQSQGKIYRLENGSVCVEPDGEETFRIHQNSFEAGNKAHLALLETSPDRIGANLNTFQLNGTLYTLLGVSGGQSLDKAQPGPSPSLRSCALRILTILDALEAFHTNGLAHLDIAPDNILLSGSSRRERALLIDYNSSLPVGPGLQANPPVFSIKQGYTAPEIRSGRIRDIGFASDLYSVTAVFFRLLTGVSLTPFQMIRPAPPDVSECACVQDEPETVKAWVKEILRRGLQAVPGRRYQSIAQMRTDLEELISRMDGLGITHWALWESGRNQAERMIRENPSLSFIRNTANLFPSMLSDGEKTFPVDEYFRKAPENCMIFGGGGMGKTTALLRLSFSGKKEYQPDCPAVIYLSLYGWQSGEYHFIMNRLLDGLHFRADTTTYDDARKSLQELLGQPLNPGREQQPVLLLLLDGLNEIEGDSKPLLDEIRRLSGLPGLRMFLAGRTAESALPFPALRITELSEDVVRQAVGNAGLLLPESPDMQKLLRTPLMLSMYLSSGQISGLHGISSAEDLQEEYLSALKEKAIRDLPEETDIRWQLEAAMDLVLPALAAEMARRRCALDNRQMLPVVEKCWNLLNGHLSRRLFPRWIGHTAAIRGNARNAEEWYGQIVHSLLWKQLGLLVRDAQERWLVMHQTVSEFLLLRDKGNRRKIRRYRSVRILLAAACVCLVLTASVVIWKRYVAPKPYEETYAEGIMSRMADAYVSAGIQYEQLSALALCARDRPDAFPDQLYVFQNSLVFPGTPSSDSVTYLSSMLETGSVMPWSGLPMDEPACRQLLSLMDSRRDDYSLYASVLVYVMTDDYARRYYGNEFPGLLYELLETDADMTAQLYQIACKPHLTGKYSDDSVTARSFNSLFAAVPEQNSHLTGEDPEQSRDNLIRLEGVRKKQEDRLYACGAFHAYEEQLNP